MEITDQDREAARQMVELCTTRGEFTKDEHVEMIAERFAEVREGMEGLQAICQKVQEQNDKLHTRISTLTAEKAKVDLARLPSACPAPTLAKDKLQELARGVHAGLPDHLGFVLMVAPFNDTRKLVEVGYIANIRREDAVNALKTMLFRWGVNEEWMKEAK